jgi:hypothetical protein
MKASAIEVGLFTAGWLLFVAAQAYNSIRSTANGLTGAAGLFAWLKLQSVNLLTRAFFCSLFYGYVMQFVAQKVAAAGLTLHAYSIAGVAGYAANALLYQAFGLLPWLRVEVQDLAPPTDPAKSSMNPAPPKGN